MHLHFTVLCVFRGVLARTICLTIELPNVIQRCYCKEKLDAGHTFQLKGYAVMLRVVNAPQINVRIKGLAVFDETCSN